MSGKQVKAHKPSNLELSKLVPYGRRGNMGEYSFCRSSGHLTGHFSVVEVDNLGDLLPKDKLMGFEKK